MIFSYDNQLFTLWVYPYRPGDFVTHLDIDVKDENNHYLENTDITIKDPITQEQKTMNCLYGACGFTELNPSAPIKWYYTYKITITKSGYSTATGDAYLSSDHQVFTFYMYPLTTQTLVPSVVPTIIIIPTQYPSTVPTLDIGDEWNSVINGSQNIQPFQTLNPTWNYSAATNITAMRENILSSNPLMYPIIAFFDLTIGSFLGYIHIMAYMMISVVMFLANPAYFIVALMTSMMGAITNYGYLFSYVITVSVAQIPIKLQNAITFTIVVGIIIQVVHLKTGGKI